MTASGSSGGPKEPSGRKGASPRPTVPRPPSFGARVGELEAHLGRIARAVAGRTFGRGGRIPRGPLRMVLSFDVDPASGRAAGAPEPLLEQMAAALRAEAAETDLFRPGRVHCHRCGGSGCEHAAPPRPTAVFAGYSPTGQPEWLDFAQLLLDRKDPRVDLLFGESPPVVPVVLPGKELKARLLPAFGRTSKSWDLLGQVAAGYFRGRLAGGAAEPFLFALTLQVVESRHADGRHRLSLNVVGQGPGGGDAEPALPGGAAGWLADEIAQGRRRLREMEEALAPLFGQAAGAGKVLSGVPGLLSDLRRGLEQAGRQQGRRTLHAQQRRRESRPTPAAVRDAAQAADEAILRDERADTLVVRGPKGRVHVFTPAGRHVTSLVLDADALRRRIDRERWRPARGEELRAFREALPRPTPDRDGG